jgi:hypothetical protein
MVKKRNRKEDVMAKKKTTSPRARSKKKAGRQVKVKVPDPKEPTTQEILIFLAVSYALNLIVLPVCIRFAGIEASAETYIIAAIWYAASPLTCWLGLAALIFWAILMLLGKLAIGVGWLFF